MRLGRSIFALLLLVLASTAAAQLGLVVDGHEIPGVTSTLVPGSSYAPAGELAAAVGSELFVDQAHDRVTLVLGGRILSLPVVDDGAEALGQVGSLDGAARAAGAAVRDGVEIFLPVKGVVEAFGGTIAYLEAERRVVGVMPRAEVTRSALEEVGQVERLRVRLSAPVPYSSFRNEALATMQLRLARTSLSTARSLEGDLILRADLIPGSAVVDLRVQFAAGTDATVTTLPADGGFELVVEARRQGAAPPAVRRSRVVVDPGHGGEDPGVRFPDGTVEEDLTWAFAEGLARALAAEGLEVSMTRDGDEPVSIEGRSGAGVGADLFVSVHAADLPAGQFRVYFLGEADSTAELEFAIRENAAAEAADEGTDAVRRRILLELVPDLGTGRRFASALGNELFQLGGYRSADTRSAPLAVLAGAAGRGLLIEFAPGDLSSEALPELLASALATILGSGGFE